VQPGPEHPFQRSRLRYDPGFALEAEYCYEKGIPHSEFLARWTPEDRAKIAAVAMEKGEHCIKCGTAQWEWDEDPDAYAGINVGCRGCLILETLQDDLANTPGPKGTSTRLVPRQTAERIARNTAEKAATGTLRPRRRRREQQ
jgi:hypothetical protein